MIVEGRVRIKTNGAFYNPRMKFCRDLDMLIYAEFDSREYLDALSATGIRGIRASLEAEKHVVFNDISSEAVKTIRENMKLNKVEGEVFNMDANVLMRQRPFEHVDIDPFGSPATFMDSACFSARRYLSITATDTAALCGSATNSGLKKYASYAIKTDTYHETGLRMLIGFAVREATKYEKALIPLISWAKEHYYRAHFRVRKSTSMAARVYGKVGFVAYCPKCLSKLALEMGEGLERCSCGGRYIILGPLWLGELKQEDFVERVLRRAEGKMQEFLNRIKEEVDVPTVYNLQRLASIARVTVPPTLRVVEELRKAGYTTSRTHYCGFCIKTDAGVADIVETMKKLRN